MVAFLTANVTASLALKPSGLDYNDAGISFWVSKHRRLLVGEDGNDMGRTWAVSDINDSGFGCDFSSSEPFGSGNVYFVDLIKIKVYYTESGGGGSSAQYTTTFIGL